MVMVMEMVISVRVDQQGRIVIPKEVRERKGLKGKVEVIEVEGGVLLRPLRRVWDKVLAEKVKVDWKGALAVSLENFSVDDLLFGVG